MNYLDMPGNEDLKSIYLDIQKEKKLMRMRRISAISFGVGAVAGFTIVTKLLKSH